MSNEVQKTSFAVPVSNVEKMMKSIRQVDEERSPNFQKTADPERESKVSTISGNLTSRMTDMFKSGKLHEVRDSSCVPGSPPSSKNDSSTQDDQISYLEFARKGTLVGRAVARRKRKLRSVSDLSVGSYDDTLADHEESLKSFQEMVSDDHSVPLFTVLPTSPWKQGWDFLVIICSIYTVVTLPIQLAFEDPSPRPEGNNSAFIFGKTLSFFNTVLDVVFIVDVILNFFVAYVDDSKWVHAKRLIGLRYLRRGFLLDFVASFPFEVVLDEGENIAVVKILKVPRLLRVMRIYRQTLHYKHMDKWRVFRLYLFLVAITHWLLCIFAAIVQYASTTKGEDWFLAYFGRPGNVVPVWDKYFAPVFSCIVYVKCMYAMLLALFGGDPNPISSEETIFVCVVRFVGPVLQAMIFGNIALVLGNQATYALEFQERMQSVTLSLQQMKLPLEYVERIMRFFEFEWNFMREHDHNWVMGLNEDLKVSVLLHINANLFRGVPIFRDAETSFIVKLVTCFTTELFLPMDFVLRESDEGDAMYFVLEGVCDTIKQQPQNEGTESTNDEGFIIVRTLVTGDFFGEIALLLPYVTRMASVIARTYVALKKINKEDFHRCLDAFPGQEKKFETFAKKKLAQYNMHTTRIAASETEGGSSPSTFTSPEENNGEETDRATSRQNMGKLPDHKDSCGNSKKKRHNIPKSASSSSSSAPKRLTPNMPSFQSSIEISNHIRGKKHDVLVSTTDALKRATLLVRGVSHFSGRTTEKGAAEAARNESLGALSRLRPEESRSFKDKNSSLKKMYSRDRNDNKLGGYVLHQMSSLSSIERSYSSAVKSSTSGSFMKALARRKIAPIGRCSSESGSLLRPAIEKKNSSPVPQTTLTGRNKGALTRPNTNRFLPYVHGSSDICDLHDSVHNLDGRLDKMEKKIDKLLQVINDERSLKDT